MKLNQLIILDVGHGNCSIVRSHDQTMVIDSPLGVTLIDTLNSLRISRIQSVFVSHSDSDHVDGITTLLMNKEIVIENVYVNPDAKKDTRSWERFRRAISDCKNRGTRFHTAISTSHPGVFSCGEIEVSILSPEPENIVAGVGQSDMAGNTIDHNTASAVIKLSYQGQPWALLPGDMDKAALESIISNKRDLSARILIFPHHGGLPGRSVDPKEFAETLCGIVNPEIIVFSNGRDSHNNPRVEIIEGIVSHGPRIACTQLSRACVADNTHIDTAHLHELPSRGRDAKSSCAGTMVFTPEDTGLSALNKHHNFVRACGAGRLCSALNT